MQLILYVCSVWIFISDSKLNEKYFTQVRRPTYVTAPLDSTEIRGSEITVACTNFIKILKFL